MSIAAKIKRSWRKNFPDAMGLLGRYPRFVTSGTATELFNELPVFCFHSVTEDRFERQLAFLSAHCYRTLDADEAADALMPGAKILPRSVVLTFDDGRRCLWKTAHPLLKKYHMKAVCFLTSGLIRTNDTRPENDPLISWEEAVEMHNEGTVDFQSHTKLHALVPTGPGVVDYVRPGLDLQFRNTELPILRVAGTDDEGREALPGTPVYRSASRMAGIRRYYDDEAVRAALISHVRESGGKGFFDKKNWRKELNRLYRHLRRGSHEDMYETEEEQAASVYTELVSSKEIIEARLPGKTVRHLCYPWFIGSEQSVALSKKAGYIASYWGVLKGRRTNRPGDDLYHIARLPEDYVFRLPGRARKTLVACIKEKIHYLSG